MSTAVVSRFVRVGILAAFACLGFSAVGAGTLAVLHLLPGVPTEAGLVLKLSIKAALFALTAGLCVLALRRIPAPVEVGESDLAAPGPSTWRTRAGLFAVIALAIALAFPNLGALPSLQPDEVHHLIVARNVAMYGKYASGHPASGFNYRDPFDSVGPSVLMPVAAAFRVAGNSIPAARSIIALHYLALCIALYFLFRPVFGAAASASGVLMVQCVFGSVYLARTLYGEVPALFYLVAALLLWRKALTRAGGSWAGVGAGVCFAVMVDCKTFMFISLWAVLAACAYDRMTERRVRWPHLVFPAIGFVSLVLGAHFAMSLLPSRGGSSIAQILGDYEHYLMFGFTSVRKTLTWGVSRPVEMFGAVAALLASVGVLFHRRHDPPLAVLFFLAPLLAYWWVFFTPGNIPRYMFYACAIGGMFAGTFLWSMVKSAFDSARSIGLRCVASAVAALMVVAAAERCWPELKSVYVSDEMRDDRDLAAYVAALPPNVSVATTHEPMGKLMILLADRYVPLIGPSTPPPESFSVVIADPQTDKLALRPALRGHDPDLTIGRYSIVLHSR